MAILGHREILDTLVRLDTLGQQAQFLDMLDQLAILGHRELDTLGRLDTLGQQVQFLDMLDL